MQKQPSQPGRTKQPKYCKFKPKDLAYVTLDGKRHYLGKHNSPESWTRYYQKLAEHAAKVPAPPPKSDARPITVGELVAAYLDHAGRYYGRSGEFGNVQAALGPVRDLYADTPAAEFGPLKLDAVRAEMVRRGLSRTGINSRATRIRRAFRWAAGREMVPASVAESLKALDGLRKGRTDAREKDPVGPAPEADILASLPFLSLPVRAMVYLQFLTGMRPGEARAMRWGDLDESGDVWTYRPGSHKTAWRGKSRTILIGPRAQKVLESFRQVDPSAPLFSPRDAVAERSARRAAARESAPTPSELAKRAAHPGSRHNPTYSRAAYRNATLAAAAKAGVSPWTPNQLRHTAATTVRARFGLEAAQAVLGHARADVTQVYAERDLARARDVMREIG